MGEVSKRAVGVVSSEVPVSAEMVEAGRSVLSSYEPGWDDSGEFVAAIYRAMDRVRLQLNERKCSGER